jgi:hypothetical protein
MTNAAALTNEQRYRISDAMAGRFINKCYDCCLVPECETCGPCAEHDPATEAHAALAWMNE